MAIYRLKVLILWTLIHISSVPLLATEATPTNPCTVCSAPGLYACPLCKVSVYCKETCREAHWKLRRHKAVCNSLKNLRTLATADGNATKIFLTEKTSKVEVREVEGAGFGLFVTKGKTANTGDFLAFYYGEAIAPDSIFKVFDAYGAEFDGVQLSGRHDAILRKRPHLGGAFANDGLISIADGMELLTLDPIQDGELNPRRAEHIVQILMQYAILESKIYHLHKIDAIPHRLNARLDKWGVIAQRKIKEGEEIGVAYGINHWLAVVTNLMSLRGYFEESLRLKEIFATALLAKVDRSSVEWIKERLRANWIEPGALARRDMNMKMMPCGKTKSAFQHTVLGGGSADYTVIMAKHRQEDLTPLLQRWIDDMPAETPINAKISAATGYIIGDSCKEMQTVLNWIRAKDRSEFFTESGEYRIHPDLYHELENQESTTFLILAPKPGEGKSPIIKLFHSL